MSVLTGDATVAPPAAPGVARRPARPVIGWAVAGGAILLLSIGCYLAWIVSGQAHPIGTGSDAVPQHVRVAVITFEILSTVAAVVAVAYVARRSLRERRLCLDAMILLGWAAAWWHDPLINWVRPTVFYNAYALNFGSWTEQVPGWFSPNAHTMPEPLFVIGAVYVWMGLLCAVLADTIMTRVRRRRPAWGPVALFAAAWVGVFAFELTMEIIAVRLQLVAYPSVISGLTVWAGHTYQLPLYEMVLWSLVLTASGALRHFRTPHGTTAVESGADRLASRGRRTTLTRVLAIIGFVNVVALSYDVVMVATSLYAGRTDTYPTYMRTQQCGPGTPVLCPGPHVPIVSATP